MPISQQRMPALPQSISPDAILDMAVSMVGSVTLLVTPPVAQALLSLNTGNRPMNGAWVETLAERMRRGAWMLTGEPVIVSREGVLNDGQHRLEAVVLSGVAVPMDVRFGVTRAAFAVTGTGKARTPGQMLSIEGHPSALRLAAAASVLVRYARYLTGRTPTYVLGAEVGHDQVKRFVDASPELAVSVRVVGCLGFRPLCNGHGVAAHYISTQHDPEKAAEFWRTVRDGLTTDARSPARQLRERLTRDALAKAKLPDTERFALALKAWLAWSAGRSVGELRVRSRGEGAEAFPVVPVALPDVD